MPELNISMQLASMPHQRLDLRQIDRVRAKMQVRRRAVVNLNQTASVSGSVIALCLQLMFHRHNYPINKACFSNADHNMLILRDILALSGYNSVLEKCAAGSLYQGSEAGVRAWLSHQEGKTPEERSYARKMPKVQGIVFSHPSVILENSRRSEKRNKEKERNMGGGNINTGSSGTGNSVSLQDWATKINQSGNGGSEKDRLMQQTKDGNFYSIKRHGALRNTLSRVAVGFGAVFGFDLHEGLNCPTKKRTKLAAEQFNNWAGNQGWSALDSVSVADVLASLKPNTDVLELDEECTRPASIKPSSIELVLIPEIPASRKGNLKDYILTDKAPTGPAAITFAVSSLGEDFRKDVNCRSIYNLVLESVVATKGTLDDREAQGHLHNYKDLLVSIENNKDFAAELCAMEKTVNNTVRRLGTTMSSSDSKEGLPSQLASLFHPELFVEDKNIEGDLTDPKVGLRKKIFELSVTRALYEMKISSPEDLRALTSILSRLGSSDANKEIGEIGLELEGVLCLIAQQDQEIVNILRNQVNNIHYELTQEQVYGPPILRDFTQQNVPQQLRNTIEALKGPNSIDSTVDPT